MCVETPENLEGDPTAFSACVCFQSLSQPAPPSQLEAARYSHTLALDGLPPICPSCGWLILWLRWCFGGAQLMLPGVTGLRSFAAYTASS